MDKLIIKKYLEAKSGKLIMDVMGNSTILETLALNYTEFCDSKKVEGIAANADKTLKEARLASLKTQVSALETELGIIKEDV